jgi:toxin-antitoxin system PIN domain toxin
MFVVDTNVLVYAANEDCQEHQRCLELVTQWRHSRLPWYLTWSIIYEFLRIVTHPRVMSQPWEIGDSWSFINALGASPSLGILTATESHERVLGQTLDEHPDLRGNLLHDAHTVVLMREHGIRSIYTRDTDFHRFSSVVVLDPLRLD